MQEDVKILKQYLLGSLSMDEMSRIDLTVIVDEHLAESLLMCETELIEEYLEGSLSEENLQFFHSNFLVSPKRLELLSEVSQLREFARSRHAQKKRRYMPVSLFGNTAQLMRMFMRPLPIAAGILIFALIGSLLWSINFSNSGSPLEKEFAALNGMDLKDGSNVIGLTTVNLYPGTLRSGKAATLNNISDATDKILFNLAILSNGDTEAFEGAILLKGGKTIFTLTSVNTYQNPNGREVRLLLPKSILQNGSYRIILAPAGRGEAALFDFTVG